MYRLNNTSEHSGVTNLYSLSNAGGSRSGTPQHHRHQQQQLQHLQHSQHLLQQQHELQQHQQHQLFDEVDHVRLVQSHNGGITHSYTLPHNLAAGGAVGGAGHVKSGGGIIQQYMAQQGGSKFVLRKWGGLTCSFLRLLRWQP